MKKLLLLLLTGLSLLSCNDKQAFKTDLLRCNNLITPAGTDSNPRFSWILTSSKRGAAQTAYQIVLDENEKALASLEKCYWNSGKTVSSESSMISFTGNELKPETKYFWKVRAWDEKGEPSEWSNPASFITGLFSQDDWNDAEWIGYEDLPDSLLLIPGVHGNGGGLGQRAEQRMVVPFIRKEFSTDKKISEAYLFICGLGHYEAFINGQKAGNSFLSPGWTNYERSCLYNTYDVTKMLRKGENAIGVILGNGFYYINRERYRKLVIAFGAPKLITKLIIKYKDGTVKAITSDKTWKTAPSPVTFSSIYGGEDYDATLEQDGWSEPRFDASGWNNAVAVRPPAGMLQPEMDFPVKVMQEFTAEKISQVNDSVFVYDFGQNASGIISLAVTGDKGKTVKLVPSELLADDSLANQKATGSPYYFSYTLKGRAKEEWSPRFSYYGFRYVQVNGAVPQGRSNPGNLPVIAELKMLHTRNSSPRAGTFKCSSDHFNSVNDLISWAIRSNIASVATDCPHREKLGWLEVSHLMGNSIKYEFDIHNLYNKVIDDMIEAQLGNGLVPDIAPEYVVFNGGFRDSPEWGSACIILPWDLYEWYGDTEAMKKAYPMMVRYLDYLTLLAPEGILIHGLGDWYDLGPKFPGVAQLTPKALTATSIYYYDALLVSRMAALMGRETDAVYYHDLAAQIKAAFNGRFFNAETFVYSTGSQTAYAMPLYFGLVEDSVRSEVLSNLIESIKSNGNALTAGDIGYNYLLKVLGQEESSQLIYDMNSRNDVPGYGYQLSKGATALTESWAGLKEVSNNHMMLGHLMEWLYGYVGGIRQSDDSRAYDKIVIAPEPVGDITWAETTYNTVHGEVTCSWMLNNKELKLETTIPANCTATVIIPGSMHTGITESGKELNNSEGIGEITSAGNKTFIKIGSGKYSFRSGFINL